MVLLSFFVTIVRSLGDTNYVDRNDQILMRSCWGLIVLKESDLHNLNIGGTVANVDFNFCGHLWQLSKFWVPHALHTSRMLLQLPSHVASLCFQNYCRLRASDTQSYISTLSPSDLTKGILVEMRKMREIRRIDANSKKRESEKDENGDRDCITAQAK